ncbi:BlaI/MecI/CopY family transcriptional regulator (plasmid) [Micrococcus luteus]|uniref:BlaI/MecI/CopY family transcriptional regulator n=1 Tax=Micrococcus luteus TaxID=1270 RepID=UPI002102D28D|nr:BlaI/MecI/CopY family transcriptional regulator [Micrococcus luteus]UTX35896.1 BlaI/MecI/CopY family transcriptional regulator [Micrococcus luteus]
MHALIDYMAAMQAHPARCCTLILPWNHLADVLKVHRRTVATMLLRLREAGLLCIVASGRSAAYTPKKDQATARAQGLEPMNEAAVYGLTVPTTPAETIATMSTTEPQAVETSCTPPALVVSKTHPRAGNDISERSRFAAQELERRRAARAAWHATRAQRTEPLWPRHATMSHDEGGRATRRAVRARLHEMARSIQEHAPDTRDLTTANVASLIRPFALAGWTVADVMHALDWGPDGARHWRGALGMVRIDAWARDRLALWTRDGEPIRSFSHIQAARAAQVRAEAEADRQRAAERRAQASGTMPAEVRAALDAMRAANAERRAAERHRRAVPVLS